MHKTIKKSNYLFPMPVLLISTYNEDETVDTMNAAWGTLEDTDVILLELTKDHKTSQNLLRNGDFTVAPATEAYMKEADYFGLVSGNDTPHKFERTSLHASKATDINAPIIEEYPISLHCKMLRIDETNGDFAVYGKIVSVSVNDEYLNEDGSLAIGKCGFITYLPMDHSYRVISKKAGDAFKEGKKLK